MGWLRAWFTRLLGGPAGDVYILVDTGGGPSDLGRYEDVVIVSVHARVQGAELAAADYARRHGPLEYAGMGSDEKSIRRLRERLVIVNRDVQDGDA